MKIKDRIARDHLYRPTEQMIRKANRKRIGQYTVKKNGDILFDERGGCFQVTKKGIVPYARVR